MVELKSVLGQFGYARRFSSMLMEHLEIMNRVVFGNQPDNVRTLAGRHIRHEQNEERECYRDFPCGKVFHGSTLHSEIMGEGGIRSCAV